KTRSAALSGSCSHDADDVSGGILLSPAERVKGLRKISCCRDVFRLKSVLQPGYRLFFGRPPDPAAAPYLVACDRGAVLCDPPDICSACSSNGGHQIVVVPADSNRYLFCT